MLINSLMYINYLNFPTIPLPLILNTELIVNTNIYTLPHLKTLFFKTIGINDELHQWLKVNIPFEFAHARYQVIYKGITPHKDSTDRVTAITYLLDTGGENIATTVFDYLGNVLQSKTIIERKWHYLTTHLTHTVTGATFNKPRVAISIDSPELYSYFTKFICD